MSVAQSPLPDVLLILSGYPAWQRLQDFGHTRLEVGCEGEKALRRSAASCWCRYHPVPPVAAASGGRAQISLCMALILGCKPQSPLTPKGNAALLSPQSPFPASGTEELPLSHMGPINYHVGVHTDFMGPRPQGRTCRRAVILASLSRTRATLNFWSSLCYLTSCLQLLLCADLETNPGCPDELYSQVPGS